MHNLMSKLKKVLGMSARQAIGLTSLAHQRTIEGQVNSQNLRLAMIDAELDARQASDFHTVKRKKKNVRQLD